MKRVWIKLYLEILDDAEFGELPEFMKWRAVELFLIAGENGDDGLLPPVARLAWRIRLDEVKIAETLSALSQVGVVHETPQGWMVTNFKKRQYSESYERVKRYRNAHCNEKETDNESLSSSDSSLERGGMGEKTELSPQDHYNLDMFVSRFGKFNNQREITRWLELVLKHGRPRALEILEWAEKKQIHLSNRPTLVDSLETAAERWGGNGHKATASRTEEYRTL